MSQEELIDAYERGEIGSWTCVRRLLKRGVPVAAAFSLLLAAPGAALADDDDDCQAGPDPPLPNVVAGTLDSPGDDCDDDGDDDGDDDDGDDDGGAGGGGDNVLPPNLNLPPNVNVP